MIKKLKRINEVIARRTTLAVSTMACVYLFTLWGILPLLLPDTREFVFYISGGILQLTLLPLIMVGQSVLNRKSEERAEADHKAVMEILCDIRSMFAQEDRVEADEKIEIADLCKLDERLVRIEKMIQRIPTSSNPNARKRRETVASV